VTFLASWRLWFLFGIAALLVAWLWSLQRRRRDTVRFTNVALLDVVAPERPGWRRNLPAVLWLVALSLLVIGWAQPARDVDVPNERATVVMAIDVSLSMEADDVDPTRLEAAQEAAVSFVQSLPEELEIGFVTFSGTATVRVSPTEDRESVIAAIQSAELAEGTAIGEAIFAGLDAVEQSLAGTGGDGSDGEASSDSQDEDEPPPARLVVMSDGETTEGRPNEEAAEAATQARIPVDTIAFGTPDGVITDEVTGEEVPVAVTPEPLQEIADTTGGSFYEADTLGTLSSAYEDIGTVVGHEKEQRQIGGWFVGFGLADLACAGLLSLVWSQRLP
jgi:Ca-activated chloride channel homolog